MPMGPIHDAAYEGDVAEMEQLLNSGVDIAEKGDNQWTVLHYAAQKGHVEACELIFNRGGQKLLPLKDEWGCTCLLWACKEGHLDVVKFLFSKDGKWLAPVADNEGNSCLHLAAYFGKTDVINFLLNNGGVKNIFATNKAGQTALKRAQEGNEPEAAALLEKAEVDQEVAGAQGMTSAKKAPGCHSGCVAQ
eukprot:CAMPEP_0206211682 /NCGR_PEP_ID=MMETSP0047_2-20121206/128_1 /ASSEMBLY_ACC=CAM_ASM_000192 /TAXON_ID=195065 /ORGANISM="Chroomonas mesostigmatica_cf, Strain CCMP1168" /LENGTH=190 /DNA_ID=CAMNT_0053633599 /DNA_START=63 /DNA_END=635 /DNA_ORIENTATION=-